MNRAIRDFLPEQIEFLANIVRLYRGKPVETEAGSGEMLSIYFFPSPSGRGAGGYAYRDIAGVCKVATLAEIEAQGCSLNPGRYVGVVDREIDGFDFVTKIEELTEEFELLNNYTRVLR